MSEAETRYEQECLGKLWTVIKAALQNPAYGNNLEIKTAGYEPSASVKLPAYVLEKFVAKPRKE